jgi:hypothetical protein
VGVRQEWSPEDVVACRTLVDGDWDLVANKSSPTRLGFCLMLKFFEVEGRFPEFIEEFPQPAVEYVAGLVKVPVTELTTYDLPGAKRHRKQIREALGFRPSPVADEDRLTAWLSTEVCPVELVENRQREALLMQCRIERIEPSGRTRVEHPAASAGPVRADVGIAADGRGPAWVDRALLVEREPLRHLPAGHGRPARPGVGPGRAPPRTSADAATRSATELR